MILFIAYFILFTYTQSSLDESAIMVNGNVIMYIYVPQCILWRDSCTLRTTFVQNLVNIVILFEGYFYNTYRSVHKLLKHVKACFKQ